MTRWISGICAGLMLISATPVSAQSVSRSPATAPTLGTTIRGTATTTFSVTTAGVVTRSSGNAIRLSTGSVTTPTLTVSCGLSLVCGRYVRVTITPVSGTGPATISRFRVGSLSGTSFRSGGAPAESSTLSFDLNPVGILGSATMKLGMDVQLAANAETGLDTFDYLVSVQFVTS